MVARIAVTITAVAGAAVLTIMGLLAVTAAGSSLDSATHRTSESNAYLPMAMQPLPTPSTPPVRVQRYLVEYGAQSHDPRFWMPAPRYWDGNGVRQISILDISPPPTDRYRIAEGTEILYWETTELTQTVTISMEADIGFLEYPINENQEWPAYDTEAKVFQENIGATDTVQVDHPEIQNQAASIVGSEKNPYKKARLIHQWMVDNIQGGSGPRDAVSVLRLGYADCAGKAHLYVALCRASGIPTRNIAGIHNPNGPVLESGNWPDRTMWFHVWTEFYLQDYGWIQVDPGRASMFAEMHEPRLVTSKGNQIRLGHGDPMGEVSWFHMPYPYRGQPYHEDSPLWLKVTRLP